MKKEVRDKIIYFSTIAVGGIIALLFECGAVAKGALEAASTGDYYCRLILEVASLALIYIALKGLKLPPLLRIAMLGVPYIISVTAYYLFLQATYAYIALILVVCMVFVFPRKNNNTAR